MLTSGYQPIQAGTVLKDPKLTETLKIIRDDPESFYNGKLAEKVVKDISIAGGLVTLDDLAEYKVITRNVIATYINDLELSTISLPSGGVSVIQLLNILRGKFFLRPKKGPAIHFILLIMLMEVFLLRIFDLFFTCFFIGYFFSPLDLDPTDPEKTAKTYHRIIEGLKFTFAQKSKYGDPAFIDKNPVNKVIIIFKGYEENICTNMFLLLLVRIT